LAQKNADLGETASLWQAVSWIAFDSYDPAGPDTDLPATNRAKWQLLEALRAGTLEAAGTVDAFPRPSFERAHISRDFWTIGIVFWDRCSVETLARQYVEVSVAKRQLEQLWKADPSAGVHGSVTLRKAPKNEIHAALVEVYASAKAENRRPPNIKEAPKCVRNILQTKGFEASDLQIQSCAASAQYANQRLRPGQRWLKPKP
jgi:hypothetical protein